MATSPVVYVYGTPETRLVRGYREVVAHETAGVNGTVAIDVRICGCAWKNYRRILTEPGAVPPEVEGPGAQMDI